MPSDPKEVAHLLWKDQIVGDIDRRAIFLIRHHGASSTHPLECRRATVIRGKSNPVERNIIFCVVTEARDDEVQWGEIPGTHRLEDPHGHTIFDDALPPRSNSISSI
jgi:hypothetical protein